MFRAVPHLQRTVLHTGLRGNTRRLFSQQTQHNPWRNISLADQSPKFVFAAFGVGISSAMLSMIVFYDFAAKKYEFEALRDRQSHFRAKYEEEQGRLAAEKGEASSLEESTPPGTASCSGAPSTGTNTAVVEPFTGAQFHTAATLPFHDSVVVRLVASSVRCMLNMCSVEKARAYAFGVYLSPAAMKACQDAETPESMYDALLSLDKTWDIVQEQSATGADFEPASAFSGAKPGFAFKMGAQGLGYYKDTRGAAAAAVGQFDPIMLRMVLAKDVHGKHLAKGFDRSVLWRVRKAQKGNRAGHGKNSLKDFTKFFAQKRDWDKDTVIDFSRNPDGSLAVVVWNNGAVEKAKKFDSPLLAWAFFDTYLGAKGHLSAPCKQDMVAKTKEILAKSVAEL